jgi:hypothetical protein
MSSRAQVLPLESRLFLSAAHPADFLPPVTVSGIVFNDSVNKNNKPDAGEGVKDCIVTFNNNVDHTVMTPVTLADGSYSAQLEPGSYHLSVDGPNVTKPYDNANFIVTADETFNILVSTDKSSSSGGTTSSHKKVDFAVSLSGVPASLVPTTKPIKVTAIISNDGDDFSGSVTTKLYFSTNKIIDKSDKHFLTVTTPAGIAKNHTAHASFNLAPIIPLLPPGQYFLIAKISAKGDSNSSNDTVITQAINVPKRKH